MKLTVNGKIMEVADGLSLRSLLEQLRLPVDGVAVALNQEVVPRGSLERRILEEGAQVEVIRAVGGG